MKKAVIQTGSKQYLVKEGDVISVERVKEDKKIEFSPLLVIDGDNVSIGTPVVDKIMVSADVVDADKLAEKVVSVRYKAKKRVHTVRGHRQHVSSIKITKIA